MCIARQCHTSLEGIQIDFSWKRIPAELYQAKKSRPSKSTGLSCGLPLAHHRSASPCGFPAVNVL